MTWKGESRRHSLAKRGIRTAKPKLNAMGKCKICGLEEPCGSGIDPSGEPFSEALRKHGYNPMTLEYSGRDEGRSFNGEPEDYLEDTTLTIWFEDLSRDSKEQEIEIRDWFKYLEEETGRSFQDKLDKAYIDLHSKDWVYGNPIDKLFKDVENILLKDGYDVYQSDTRMLIWKDGIIPEYYEEE